MTADVELVAVSRQDSPFTSEELDDLTELLVACVNEGASIGFYAPLAPDRARAWWSALPRPGATVFVARRDGHIIGSVQLLAAESENGGHRGEVAKLLVHPRWRRRGIARKLMAALECEALAQQKTLLVLDTREGDPSNDLYRALGYQTGGRIPSWARDVHGTESATIFWYKPLA